MHPSCKILAALGFLLTSEGSFGLSHQVSNFRLDFTGNAADTTRIAASFGDTLLLSVLRQEYRPVGYKLLTDGKSPNGFSGTLGMAAARGPGLFDFAYVSWTAAHAAAPVTIPAADLRLRQAYITDDSMGFDADSRYLVQNEMPTQLSGNRAPSHLFYDAVGTKHIAYWSSLDNGTLRRTSDLSSAGGGAPNLWASSVALGDTVFSAAYGALGACLVPGSQARRTVLAYTASVMGPVSTIEIRWEDLTAQTSTKVAFTRSVIPEEFSVASDTGGRSVLIWREGAVLYLAAYDSNHVILQTPVSIGGIAYRDVSNTLHNYRSFHVIAVRNQDFHISYMRGTAIFSRNVKLTASGATVSSTEIQISKTGKTSYFPSISSNENQIAYAWFERQNDSTHWLMASVFNLKNGQPDTVSRINVNVSDDTVSFKEVKGSWNLYHFFETASIALDPIGNFAVGYEDGYHAKGALVKFASIYPDSGIFLSKALSVTNPAASFTFNSSQDSVEYRPLQVTASTQVEVRLAVSKDLAFAAPTDTFRLLAAPLRTTAGQFKYRVRLMSLDTAHLFTSKLQALTVPYNVKPTLPVSDSVKFANGLWRVYNAADTTALIRRRDTVEMVFTGRDLDDGDSLLFTVRLGSRVLVSGKSGKKTGIGQYSWHGRFAAPDTLLPSVTFSITTSDSNGWSSNSGTAVVRLADALPITVVTATRHRGLDSLGQFYPGKGLSDSLTLKASDTTWAHSGDSLRIQAAVTDKNDDSITISIKRNNGTATVRKIRTGTNTAFTLPAPLLVGVTDTWLLQSSDPDTTLDFKIFVKGNSPPTLDSLWLAGYQQRDGTKKVGASVIRNFTGQPDLIVPAQVSATLKVAAHDADGGASKPSVKMELWHRNANCNLGDRTCISVVTQSAVDTLLVQVQVREEQLAVRATDSRGAFTESLVRLTYAFADTSSTQQYRAQVLLLDSALDFIMLSGTTEKTISAVIRSQGSAPLQLISASTSRNQIDHLDLTFSWKDSANVNRTISFLKNTTQNPIASAANTRIPSGQDLTLTFRFFTDALKTDTLFIDTLVLRTNDLANPILRIPFRLIHRQLPRLSRMGPFELDSILTEEKKSATLALQSGLRLVFSEPVLIPTQGFLTVYSLLDSLANPKGYKPIPGQIIKKRIPAGALARQASEVYNLALARAKMGALADSLADTVLFIPAYTKASDSLKALPKPGRFLHHDILRIRIANSATDPMGNAVDLRHDHTKRVAGTLDTIFTVHTDTSVLRLTRSSPAPGDSGVDPDGNVTLYFNQPLAVRAPPAWTQLPKVDLVHLGGDENTSFTVKTTRTHGKALGFKSIAVGLGDTVLILKLREKAVAYDTVTVTLSGSLSDTAGNTLDGDSDGFPAYLYDPQAGVDDLIFSFATGRASFYVYPNPFRFDNARHRDKGSVTFKNLNVLPGWSSQKILNIRIHDMTGDLIWNDSKGNSSADLRGRATVDWDLRNSQGSLVATGVYVYTITENGDRLLMKGKVAIIR